MPVKSLYPASDFFFTRQIPPQTFRRFSAPVQSPLRLVPPRESSAVPRSRKPHQPLRQIPSSLHLQPQTSGQGICSSPVPPFLGIGRFQIPSHPSPLSPTSARPSRNPDRESVHLISAPADPPGPSPSHKQTHASRHTLSHSTDSLSLPWPRPFRRNSARSVHSNEPHGASSCRTLLAPSALLPLPPNPKNLPPDLVSQFHCPRTEQQCENQCRRESFGIVSQQVLGKNKTDERAGQQTADYPNGVLHTFFDQGGFRIARS